MTTPFEGLSNSPGPVPPRHSNEYARGERRRLDVENVDYEIISLDDLPHAMIPSESPVPRRFVEESQEGMWAAAVRLAPMIMGVAGGRSNSDSSSGPQTEGTMGY